MVMCHKLVVLGLQDLIITVAQGGHTKLGLYVLIKAAIYTRLYYFVHSKLGLLMRTEFVLYHFLLPRNGTGHDLLSAESA
jgi:hypothetical protein